MIPFYSKRNQVYPVLWQGQAAVEKHFLHPEGWQREVALYTFLESRLPLPRVLETSPDLLVTKYLPHPTVLAELERQEAAGFSPEPWLALADWLRECHALCALLPGEGNLRNFLWDSSRATVIGLDLEDFLPVTPAECGAGLAAALLEYDPGNTPVKQQAAALLAQSLRVPPRSVQAARQALRARREGRSASLFTGVILAGGASRRMGQSKAGLSLRGKTLLQWQVEKMQALGAEEILLSGANCPTLPGTRVVPDLYPARGPLGGLHACLGAAKTSRCLVLSVDAPLVPACALNHLLRAHTGGVTVLSHPGGTEPLMGVYDSHLAQVIQPLIREDGAPVRALRQRVPWNRWDYLGPRELLHNCNTPEDYALVTSVAEAYGRLFPQY